MEPVFLACTQVDYDEELDVLTTKWRAFRPCKVGELDDEQECAMVNDTVEFIGRKSEKLQVLVPDVIRFHGLKNWPLHASYWLQTSIAPFLLAAPALDVQTPNLAHLFANAYRLFVLGKPLKK